MRTILFLLALLIAKTTGKCVCYHTSNVNGTSVQLSNPYDNQTFAPCLPESDCIFFAYSGSSTLGWSTLAITPISPNNANGYILIYDGNSTRPSYKFNVSTEASYTLQLQNPIIKVQYTSLGTNEFFGAIYANGSLYVPTSPPSSTPIPTTQSFSPIFINNPKLITHDLFVIINQKTTQGSNGIQSINNISDIFVQSLAITPFFNSSTGTRLTLGLFSYGDVVLPIGNVWQLDEADFYKSLPVAPLSKINITIALEKLIPQYFNISSDDNEVRVRPRAQRTVILFTSDDGEIGDLSPLESIFTNYGVNLAIIGFNLTDNSKLRSDSFYNYKNLTSVSAQSVSGFINDFFLSSSSETNNWAQKNEFAEGKNAIFNLPLNYQGPNINESWPNLSDGQKGNYLNYQSYTFTFNNSNKARLNVSVNYELETEKDYLRFYADGVEIESFTGYDVNTANFLVESTVQQLVGKFTSDNKNVYGGFIVDIKAN